MTIATTGTSWCWQPWRKKMRRRRIWGTERRERKWIERRDLPSLGNSPEAMKAPKSSVLYLHIFCHSFHIPLTVGLKLKKNGPLLLSTCQMPRKVQGKNHLPANSSPRCDSQKLGVHLISLLAQMDVRWAWSNLLRMQIPLVTTITSRDHGQGSAHWDLF